MLKPEFAALLDLMEKEEHATILGKGEEYTRSQADRLASFKEIASWAGVKPLQVCMIFMAKHWQGFANFVATGQVKSNEDVTGRIMDLRVYLALARALITEERQNLRPPEVKLSVVKRDDGTFWLHLEDGTGKFAHISVQPTTQTGTELVCEAAK